MCKQSNDASDTSQLKKLLLNKSHLTFKSRCVTTEGGAGAAVWWRLALGREFTPANSKTAEDRGAERDTSDPRSRRGIKTLQVLFDRFYKEISAGSPSLRSARCLRTEDAQAVLLPSVRLVTVVGTDTPVSHFLRRYLQETSVRREETELSGENLDFTGREYSKPGESFEWQLPLVAVGSIYRKGWLAGLLKVLQFCNYILRTMMLWWCWCVGVELEKRLLEKPSC